MPQSPTLLGELASLRTDIRFACSDCGAGLLVPIARLLQRLGAGARLADIQARAVCGRCGSIDVEVRPAVAALA